MSNYSFQEVSRVQKSYDAVESVMEQKDVLHQELNSMHKEFNEFRKNSEITNKHLSEKIAKLEKDINEIVPWIHETSIMQGEAEV